ncbi:MAG: c-type cytochrome [Acidimicrobiales bacterium]
MIGRPRFPAAVGVPVLVAVIATVAVGLLGPSRASAQTDGADPPATDRAVIDRGAALYADHCISCHGPDGVGVDRRGPALTEEGEAAADFAIRTGRMPDADPDSEARRKQVPFTEDEIVALVAYVGSIGSGPDIPPIDMDAADPVRGGEIYRLNCAACHVASGAGSIIGGGRHAPALNKATADQVAEAITIGPGAMPVFAELSTGDQADVAAYVLALQTDGAAGPMSLGGVGPVAEGLAAWLLALAPLVAFTRWIGRGARQEVEDDAAAGTVDEGEVERQLEAAAVERFGDPADPGASGSDRGGDDR